MLTLHTDIYYVPLLFIVLAILFLVGGLVFSKIIRPHRPNAEKNEPYECGEDFQGSAKGAFNFRFLAVAVLFILFEAEILFLFPWATVAGDTTLIRASNGWWGWVAVAEAFVFAFILIVGLVYAWKHGLLEWDKPSSKATELKTPVTKEDYLAHFKAQK